MSQQQQAIDPRLITNDFLTLLAQLQTMVSQYQNLMLQTIAERDKVAKELSELKEKQVQQSNQQEAK